MNLNCIGYYFIKESSTTNKKENKWIKATMDINAQINRYVLEIKPVVDDDDIYDEDDDDRIQRLPKKLKLSDYKTCEPRGSQKFNNSTLFLLALNPKIFSKAKKLLLAFLTEEIQHIWYENLEIILTHKFQNMSSTSSGSANTESSSNASVEQFMIDNDVYEGSLMPGEFLATVLDNSKSKDVGIKGRYILVVTDYGLELKEEYTDKVIKIWDIKIIRRFGEKDNIFSFELGKFSEDGPGLLCFQVEKGKQILRELLQTKENCMKIKSNRASVLKTSDDLICRSPTSNTDSFNYPNPSLRMTFFHGDSKLHINPEDLKNSELLKKHNSRMETFEPPKIAPPPIPLEFPKQTFESLIELD